MQKVSNPEDLQIGFAQTSFIFFIIYNQNFPKILQGSYKEK